MRLALTILPLAALAACATPREQCLSQATRDARINAALIAEVEGNISRGFGVEVEERVRRVPRRCRGETESGEPVITECDDVRIDKVRKPVALDLNAERAKLRRLLAERDRIAARTGTAVSQCQALYPE